MTDLVPKKEFSKTTKGKFAILGGMTIGGIFLLFILTNIIVSYQENERRERAIAHAEYKRQQAEQKRREEQMIAEQKRQALIEKNFMPMARGEMSSKVLYKTNYIFSNRKDNLKIKREIEVTDTNVVTTVTVKLTFKYYDGVILKDSKDELAISVEVGTSIYKITIPKLHGNDTKGIYNAIVDAQNNWLDTYCPRLTDHERCKDYQQKKMKRL